MLDNVILSNIADPDVYLTLRSFECRIAGNDVQVLTLEEALAVLKLVQKGEFETWFHQKKAELRGSFPQRGF